MFNHQCWLIFSFLLQVCLLNFYVILSQLVKLSKMRKKKRKNIFCECINCTDTDYCWEAVVESSCVLHPVGPLNSTEAETQRSNTLTTCWLQGCKDFKCPWVNLCESSLISGWRQNCQSLWPATGPKSEASYPRPGSPWGWWACCRRRLSLPASRTAEESKNWLGATFFSPRDVQRAWWIGTITVTAEMIYTTQLKQTHQLCLCNASLDGLISVFSAS